MPITKEKKIELLEVLREKLRKGKGKSYKKIAQDFNVTERYIKYLLHQVRCDVKIEKLKLEYEGRIIELEKDSSTKSEREKTVLDTLYHLCVEDKEKEACIAWYRATGAMKEAEVRARDGQDDDRFDFRTAVDKL